MEHQYRRGIYRPNAQRLSISLAPLVAQRSLLFRIKADLATKTNYAELTPTDSSSSASISPSPGLFVITASARIFSAALSALSTCSVYSQESWQGASPFAPAPTRALAPLFLNIDDTRRHAIAFSPSVQWEALSEDSDSSDLDGESGVKTPLQSAAAVPAVGSVSSPQTEEVQVCAGSTKREQLRLSTNSSILSPFFRGAIQSPKSPRSVVEEQPPVKLEEMPMEEAVSNPPLNLKKRDSAAKRISKHAKAFGKAMGHLSMQPSNKKDTTTITTTTKDAFRRQTTVPVITHLHIGHADYMYKLPDVQRRLSPIRMSFIAKVPNATAPVPTPVQSQLPQAIPDVAVAAISLDGASSQPGINAIAQSMPTRPRPPRSIRPPPTPSNYSSDNIQIQRPITPAPVLPIPPPMPASRKGHRRYNSSPAVPNFKAIEFKGWDRADMPPLPTMPSFVAVKFELGVAPPRPPRSRARSDGDAASGTTMRGHLRAVSVV